MLTFWGKSWLYQPITTPVTPETEEFKDVSRDGSMESDPTTNDFYQPKKPVISVPLSLKVGIIVVVATVSIGLAIFFLLWIHGHHKTPPHYKTHVLSNTKTNDKPHLCGNSSIEALALGCKFDQLLWTWLPPHCSHFANDEFMSVEEKPWRYYEDIEGTKLVEGENWDKVLNGELIIFGERREHVTHCIYIFMSLGQVVRDSTTEVSEKLKTYKHIRHCAMLLYDIVKTEKEWNKVQTVVGTVSFDQTC